MRREWYAGNEQKKRCTVVLPSVIYLDMFRAWENPVGVCDVFLWDAGRKRDALTSRHREKWLMLNTYRRNATGTCFKELFAAG